MSSNDIDITGLVQYTIDRGGVTLSRLWEQEQIGDPSPGNGKTIYIWAMNSAGVTNEYILPDAETIDITNVYKFVKG